MRIVFVGAVQSSASALAAMLETGTSPALVVTLPADKSDRHSDFVDLRGIASNLPVHVTGNINSKESLDAIRAVNPDLCLVIGWSQHCGREFRNIPKLGCIGFHPSPLPRLRGRAVIPWTILLGEQSSASTLFWLEEGIDSGDIVLQRHFDVAPDETARTLYDKHLANIASMVPKAIELLSANEPVRLPQDHSRASYCARRTQEDGLIDWRQPAEAVLRLCRAVGDPYPGAFTFFRGRPFTVAEASMHPQPERYIGIAGQVQAIEGDVFVVRCGDGRCVAVKLVAAAEAAAPRLHSRFDISQPATQTIQPP